MLEDLLTAALNEVLDKVQSMQMGQLAGLAGSLGIGGIPGLQAVVRSRQCAARSDLARPSSLNCATVD